MSEVDELKLDYKPVALLGGVCIAITGLGIVSAAILRMCLRGKCRCCFMWLNPIILFALAIVLMVFGGILAAVGAAATSGIIEEGCANAAAGKYTDILPQLRDVFQKVVELDGEF